MLHSDAKAKFIHKFIRYKKKKDLNLEEACASLDALSETVVMGTEQRHVGAVRPRGFDSRGAHAHPSC